MVWVISIAVLVLVAGMGVVLFVVSRSRDDDGLDRGEGGFSGKYGRGFRDDSPRDDDRSSERAARDAVAPVVKPPVHPVETPGTVPVQEIVSVDDLRGGDFVQITDAVAGQRNIQFTVAGVNHYQTDEGGWSEYFGKQYGRTIYLESFPDTEGEVGIVFSDATLALDRVGLTEEALIQWDEGQATRSSFEYDGETWEFEWCGVVSRRSLGADSEGSYYGWDFVGSEGRRILCVEKREGDPFEVCLVHLIDVHRIHATRD